MHDLAVGPDAAVDLLGAERLLVPVNRLRRVVQGQLRRDRVIPSGTAFAAFAISYLLSAASHVTDTGTR